MKSPLFRPSALLIFVLAFVLNLAGQPAVAGGGGAATATATTTAATGGGTAMEDALARIRDEGLNRSEVMTTLLALTDRNGPRLTGSPGLRQASEWSRSRLAEWGLAKARLEPWGPFGRGWSLRRFSAQVVAPVAMPLIAFPKAWSPTVGKGVVEAETVFVDIKKAEDFARYRGKLRGKIVLDGAAPEIVLRFEPLATRRSDTNLLTLANAAEGTSGTTRPGGPSPLAAPEQRAALGLQPRRYQFFAAEKVALVLQASRQGEAGTLFTTAALAYPPRGDGAEAAPADGAAKQGAAGTRNVSPWKTDCPPILPQVAVAAEHYQRLVRLAQAKESLRLAVELRADYHSDNLMSANVLAEIPGTDLAGEVVMLGAHLDSWHSGTGATDNGAGCAVVMEAVRILRTLDLPPRRTIRVALWGGEEQGLLGSKAFVAEHLGSARTPAGTEGAARDNADPFAVARGTAGNVDKKSGYDSLSAYFNLDNGAGKIRGLYLQGNEAARGLFRTWLKPLRDLGADTLTLANTGSTDHVPFDAIGLPGFQFIQDEIEYWTRTHHANMDVYDRVVADDLKQAAVVMATVVYQAAMENGKVPRKSTLPAPGPSRGRGKRGPAGGGAGAASEDGATRPN